MKKITFLFFLFAITFGYSQVVLLEDFDSAAPTVTWNDDNGNATATVSTTQASSGANSLELISTAAGAPWQGAKLLMQTNKIDMRDATTGVGTNKTVTFQLYSNTPRRFLLKLSDGDIGGTTPAQESKTAVAHGGTGWELMTADFTVGADLGQPGYNPPNDQFSSIFFFPLFATDGSDGWDVCCDPNIALMTTTYIDDVSSYKGDYILDLIENFDGAAPTVTWNDDNDNATAAVSTTQASSGANSLELISTAAGAPWQGAKLLMQTNKIDMRDATTGVGTNKIVTFQLYSNTPRRFLLKLSDGDVGGTTPAQESKTAVAHGGTGWELMVADFTVGADLGQPGYNPPNDQFSSIFFFPLFATDGSDGWDVCCDPNIALMTTTYIDDVSSHAGDPIGPTCTDGIMNGDETGIDCGGTNCAPCAMPPPTAAPTPPARPVADVVSIFSDAYTDITVTEWGPVWGGSSARINDLTIATDPSKVMEAGAGQVFAGIDFAANAFDATSFTHFHVDYWINSPLPAGQALSIKLSNHVGGAGETSAIETVPTPAAGMWVSLDVPLASFAAASAPASLDRTAIAQIVITAARADGNEPVDLYLDNIYFHKNTVLSTEEFGVANFKVYPNPTLNNWNIESNTTIRSITVYDILGKQVSRLTPNQSNVEVSTSNIKSGVYFAKIEGDNGSKTVKLVKQ